MNDWLSSRPVPGWSGAVFHFLSCVVTAVLEGGPHDNTEGASVRLHLEPLESPGKARSTRGGGVARNPAIMDPRRHAGSTQRGLQLGREGFGGPEPVARRQAVTKGQDELLSRERRAGKNQSQQGDALDKPACPPI